MTATRTPFLRSDGKPTGIQSVPDRARAAYRMAVEGASRAEIARVFGVSVGCVQNWVAMVRAHDADARNMRGMR